MQLAREAHNGNVAVIDADSISAALDAIAKPRKPKREWPMAPRWGARIPAAEMEKRWLKAMAARGLSPEALKAIRRRNALMAKRARLHRELARAQRQASKPPTEREMKAYAALLNRLIETREELKEARAAAVEAASRGERPALLVLPAAPVLPALPCWFGSARSTRWPLGVEAGAAIRAGDIVPEWHTLFGR